MLESESAIAREILQRFFAGHAGIPGGWGTPKGIRNHRVAFDKTIPMVDDGSLASTEQLRDSAT